MRSGYSVPRPRWSHGRWPRHEIILSKAFNDEGLMGRQTRLYRNHVKLLFGG